MTEQTDIPQSVEAVEEAADKPAERDDYNNANLRTYEVTWEHGTVEHVPAHWVFHPTASPLDKTREHIKFAGWYDGEHRTILSARPDRIRCIRDLGILAPLPDVEAPLVIDLGLTIPTPPETVRIDSDLFEKVVTHPDWNGGRPVRVTALLGDHEDDVPPDHVRVHWESLQGHVTGTATVPEDFQVYPWGGE
ncbi:hypothetical protein [Streptosporangium sp. NPDC051022]|uniref:hypothetical protein n=1 Tax=Streptosporangium sp. NPDC051022 TaxID=3155752 RepID=UPI00341857B7